VIYPGKEKTVEYKNVADMFFYHILHCRKRKKWLRTTQISTVIIPLKDQKNIIFKVAIIDNNIYLMVSQELNQN
jgi:hypothetical protein